MPLVWPRVPRTSVGKRMRAAKLMSKSIFVRELLPRDLKIEIERLTRQEALKVAQYLAAMVGKAHSRQMDAVVRKQWQTDLKRNRSKPLDAPNWLWSTPTRRPICETRDATRLASQSAADPWRPTWNVRFGARPIYYPWRPGYSDLGLTSRKSDGCSSFDTLVKSGCERATSTTL